MFMEELSYVLTKDFVSCVHVHFYERDSCVADTLKLFNGKYNIFGDWKWKKNLLVFSLLSPREGLGYGEIGGWVWGGGGGVE